MKVIGENRIADLWDRIKNYVDPKADKIPEVNHGTSDTTFTLTPNIMHIWGEVSSLTLTFPEDTNTVLDEFMFTFTSPSTPTTLTLPATIKWIQEPNIEAGKTYLVSVVNGLAGYLTDGMEISGGDENIIEEITVNGTTVPVVDKVAAITTGTINSVTVNGNNYTPDANGLVNLGTISGGSGDGEANVIESVKVNGTALTVTNKAVDITAVPASIVTQDATHRFVSDTEKTTWNNKVSNVQADWNATSGLAQILNKPTIPAAPGTLNTNNTTTQTASASEALSGAIKLHKVSKTGSYNDLLDKPTIPTALTDLTADSTHRLVTDTEKSTWNSKASTDTKNTAGATATTVTGSNKLYLIGASEQTANPTTNTINYFYVDASGLNIPTNINALSQTATLGKIILPGTGGGILADGTGDVQSTTKVWNTFGSYTDISGFITSSDLPTLSKGTTTGSGNAVTDISVSGHTITLTKGNTFLTSVSGDDIIYENSNASEIFIGPGDTINECLASLEEAIVTKANGVDVVHKTGTETISGNKTFSGETTITVGPVINFIVNGEQSGESLKFVEGGNAYVDILNTKSDFGWIMANNGSLNLLSVLDAKEVTSNKVTSISSSSTNTQYPSALAVYNFGTNLVGQLTKIYSGSGAPASSLGNNGDIYIKVS